jgi:hypothetical protein
MTDLSVRSKVKMVNPSVDCGPTLDAVAVSGPPAGWPAGPVPTEGAVVIGDHIDPTNPHRVYELDDPAQCKYLYEIVLADGTGDDINRLIDRRRLAELWHRLYLPASVRQAWSTAIAEA